MRARTGGSWWRRRRHRSAPTPAYCQAEAAIVARLAAVAAAAVQVHGTQASRRCKPVGMIVQEARCAPFPISPIHLSGTRTHAMSCM